MTWLHKHLARRNRELNHFGLHGYNLFVPADGLAEMMRRHRVRRGLQGVMCIWRGRAARRPLWDAVEALWLQKRGAGVLGAWRVWARQTGNARRKCWGHIGRRRVKEGMAVIRAWGRVAGERRRDRSMCEAWAARKAAWVTARVLEMWVRRTRLKVHSVHTEEHADKSWNVVCSLRLSHRAVQAWQAVLRVRRRMVRVEQRWGESARARALRQHLRAWAQLMDVLHAADHGANLRFRMKEQMHQLRAFHAWSGALEVAYSMRHVALHHARGMRWRAARRTVRAWHGVRSVEWRLTEGWRLKRQRGAFYAWDVFCGRLRRRDAADATAAVCEAHRHHKLLLNALEVWRRDWLESLLRSQAISTTHTAQTRRAMMLWHASRMNGIQENMLEVTARHNARRMGRRFARSALSEWHERSRLAVARRRCGFKLAHRSQQRWHRVYLAEWRQEMRVARNSRTLKRFVRGGWTAKVTRRALWAWAAYRKRRHRRAAAEATAAVCEQHREGRRTARALEAWRIEMLQMTNWYRSVCNDQLARAQQRRAMAMWRGTLLCRGRAQLLALAAEHIAARALKRRHQHALSEWRRRVQTTASCCQAVADAVHRGLRRRGCAALREWHHAAAAEAARTSAMGLLFWDRWRVRHLRKTFLAWDLYRKVCVLEMLEQGLHIKQRRHALLAWRKALRFASCGRAMARRVSQTASWSLLASAMRVWRGSVPLGDAKRALHYVIGHLADERLICAALSQWAADVHRTRATLQAAADLRERRHQALAAEALAVWSEELRLRQKTRLEMLARAWHHRTVRTFNAWRASTTSRAGRRMWRQVAAEDLREPLREWRAMCGTPEAAPKEVGLDDLRGEMQDLATATSEAIAALRQDSSRLEDEVARGASKPALKRAEANAEHYKAGMQRLLSTIADLALELAALPTTTENGPLIQALMSMQQMIVVGEECLHVSNQTSAGTPISEMGTPYGTPHAIVNTQVNSPENPTRLMADGKEDGVESAMLTYIESQVAQLETQLLFPDNTVQ
ncbi:hypothetical protein CYMTET_52079 [Cymbomonas tetramitiformis]|uniref:Uncharacterized protein n=1 Tax=Cymbomonas tetramitiformis TaxID=36881 RepID=A0AAE0ES05_9CHLO|nr:hypothetical protein CYMTET_52079 [Cymbomonas tetramitiformis]